MNKIFIALISLIILSLIIRNFLPIRNMNNKDKQISNFQKERIWKKQDIKIGDKNYEIFVTESEEDRKLGLSVFEDIDPNQGMLFEFPEENFYSFWMKDMKFDIDIIFLDKDKKIIQIFENIQKDTYQNNQTYKTYIPKLKSKYVIELKSGESKKNNLRLGDVIIF